MRRRRIKTHTVVPIDGGFGIGETLVSRLLQPRIGGADQASGPRGSSRIGTARSCGEKNPT
jgi:hypothetical protein